MIEQDLQVEKWPIERLRPYDRNSRTHTEAQVAEIVASIRRFGFVNPILVDPDGVIIAGHARHMAAQKMGRADVPVIVLAHLSPEERRALVIADNRIALNAGWNQEILEAELFDLRAQQFDLTVLGFTDGELREMLRDVAAVDMPTLAASDRAPFRQMTFNVHDEQFETIKAALARARDMGPFVGSLNENANANALARVCEVFLASAVGGDDANG